MMADHDLLNIPWIDSHVHVQTLSWNDAETFALGGARGAVMIATNYHWSPYRPVQPNEVKWLWDLAVKWSHHIEKGHFYHVRVATAVHTLAKVEAPDEVFEFLPSYLRKPEVIALGEFGIEPVQYTSAWPLEEQRYVVRRQFEIAKQNNVPAIVHTPVQKLYRQGWDEDLTKPQLEWPTAKVEATKMDIELAREAGIDERNVVIDHADASIVDLVLGDSQCNLAFSIGSPWRKVGAPDIADAVRSYGADRIMVDSDLVGNMYGDMSAMKRTILDLHRNGVALRDIKKLVFDNANRVFGGVFTEPVGKPVAVET